MTDTKALIERLPDDTVLIPAKEFDGMIGQTLNLQNIPPIPIADLKALVTQFEARGRALERYADDHANGYDLKAEGQSSPWVAVADRLPPSFPEMDTLKNYIVSTRFLTFEATWSPMKSHWQGYDGERLDQDIIAWQPLPAPFTPPSDTGQSADTEEV